MRKLFQTICLVAIAGMISCEHKKLCYHHAHLTTVRVEFDWRDAPDANPAGMCIWFYPLDSEDAPTRVDIDGKEGGYVTVTRGRYNIIAYNNDNETTYFNRCNDFVTHEVSSFSGGLFEPLGYSGYPVSRGEPVSVCPEVMWICTSVDAKISESGVSYICVPESEKDQYIGLPIERKELVITLFPHEVISTYTFEIHGVEERDEIFQVSGSLSSMAPSMLLYDESLGEELVTLPFNVEYANLDAPMTGKFLTFGCRDESSAPQTLLLYIWHNDGTRWYHNFDVSDQIRSAPDRRNVHIIIHCSTPPKELELDAVDGAAPNVDPWDSENHDLRM